MRVRDGGALVHVAGRLGRDLLHLALNRPREEQHHQRRRQSNQDDDARSPGQALAPLISVYCLDFAALFLDAPLAGGGSF